MSTTRERLIWVLTVATACAAALALAALAASENGASDIETMQRTALAVQDADARAKQVSDDELFARRVQMTGDTICLRTAGPGYRAVWQGSDDTLHCVPKGTSTARDRLMLADGGK